MKAVTLSDFKELKKSRPWTKDDDKRLRELFLAKKTDKEISDLLGRSLDAVQIRRSKIGATSWRNKKAKPKLIRPITGGGKPKEYGFEALKHTQDVLKLLGYKLVITKLGQ